MYEAIALGWGELYLGIKLLDEAVGCDREGKRPLRSILKTHEQNEPPELTQLQQNMHCNGSI